MQTTREGCKTIVIQRLEFDGSVQPVIYSFSAASRLRRTQRGFVVMGGLKLRLTLKPYLRKLSDCFYIMQLVVYVVDGSGALITECNRKLRECSEG